MFERIPTEFGADVVEEVDEQSVSPERLERSKRHAHPRQENDRGLTMESTVETHAADRRSSKRQKRLQGGRIVFNNKHSVISCNITDLSESGARLEVGVPIDVPACFELLMVDGSALPSEVVWRKGNRIGVRFVGARKPAPPSERGRNRYD